MNLENHIIHTQGGKLSGDTSRDDLSNIMENIRNHGGNGGIVLHFHGGLVNKAAGTAIATRLLPQYQAENAYPLFFVWEAGLLETLKNNWKSIAQEALFKKIRTRIIKMAKRKLHQAVGERSSHSLPDVDATRELQAIEDAEDNPDALRLSEPAIPEDLTELTTIEEQRLEAELQYDFSLLQEVERVSQGLKTPTEIEQQRTERSSIIRASNKSLMDADALEEYIERPTPGERGFLSTLKILKAVVKIVARVIKRYVTKRDHGFHATIVEEILRALYVSNAGKIVWSTMKRDTFDHFKEDSSTHGGSALLEELKTLPHDALPKITLVGHSTGAVFISAFLEAADRELPTSFTFDVIYLAPASTLDLTTKSMDNHWHRVDNFRMFTMSDEYEKKDTLVDNLQYFYPHSLLYFISGVVEDEIDKPLTGMQRFYRADKFPIRRFPEHAPVRSYMNVDRAIWSVTDNGNGKRSNSKDHGDFDNDTATINSIKHILKHGF